MATATPEQQALIAGNRFSMGLRPGELDNIMSAPVGWLQAQLPGIATIPAALAGLGNTTGNLIAALQAQQTRMQLQDSTDTPAAQREQRALLAANRLEQRNHLATRMAQAITTPAGFAEHLVRFWSNHFSVSHGGGVKQLLRRIVVPYEQEAIRNRLGGNFAGLLLAVLRHPAMLIYLDNHLSMGADSQLGRQRNQGLNENLGREVLELHTLGVNGGYTQADVTAMANMLTGWTVDLGRDPNSMQVGNFVFTQLMHQPGAQQLLGKTYNAPGQEQAERALQDLAVHPATAHHIATKLVRHFIADVPPAWAVTELEQVFLESGGNLPELHAALAALLPGVAADPALRKLKSAEEYVISAARPVLADSTPEVVQAAAHLLIDSLITFAQEPFTAPSPAGWPEAAEDWGSPDALLKRVKWAQSLQPYMPATLDAAGLYAALLPPQPLLGAEIMAAGSNQQGLVLLFGSPQFQWR